MLSFYMMYKGIINGDGLESSEIGVVLAQARFGVVIIKHLEFIARASYTPTLASYHFFLNFRRSTLVVGVATN